VHLIQFVILAPYKLILFLSFFLSFFLTYLLTSYSDKTDDDDDVLVVSRWRRRVILSGGGSNLRLFNVTESDAGVLQCNASNHHGYVFANVYLTVHGWCPQFADSLKPYRPIKHSVGIHSRLKIFAPQNFPPLSVGTVPMVPTALPSRPLR